MKSINIEVFNILCELILDQLSNLGIAYNEDLHWNTNLLRDIGMDDLDLIEIHLAIEERFYIKNIPDDMANIGKIVNFIIKQLGKDLLEVLEATA